MESHGAVHDVYALVPISMIPKGTPLLPPSISCYPVYQTSNTVLVKQALHKMLIIYVIVCFFQVYSQKSCFLFALKTIIYIRDENAFNTEEANTPV